MTTSKKSVKKQRRNKPAAAATQSRSGTPLAERISRGLQEGRARAGVVPAAARDCRRPWQALLEGDLAERAQNTVLQIAETLRDMPMWRPPEAWDPCCGPALLFGYLAAAEPGAPWSSISKDYMDQAVAHIADVPARASLYSGFVGVGWTVAHLEGHSVGANDDANESLDNVLRRFLHTTPWRADFDLIEGLAGLGVYALERIDHPIGRECLSLVVDRLAEQAESQNGGLTWHSKPALFIPETANEFPLGYYNCGVAHGVPAVALILAGACRAGVNAARAWHLLEGAMSWMLASRLEENSPSAFPFLITPDGTTSGPARSAWCYGDPGVAATMFAVASAVENTSWQREALAVARRASARPMSDCGVVDAGLCHGAAGLALLYNRMWQATGDDSLRDSAIRWYEHTLNLKQPGLGVAGYQAYMPGACDEDHMWIDDPGFLEGAAGIALSLLAAISPIEPAWDVMLAASLPSVVTDLRLAAISSQ